MVKKKKKNGKKKLRLFGRTLKEAVKEAARREKQSFKQSRRSGQGLIDFTKTFGY